MDVSTVLSTISTIQSALHVLSGLSLFTYEWPPQATVQNEDTFDFIVVGAGTAGCIVASRLSENKDHKVLLIEAGGDPQMESVIPNLLSYLPKTSMDWNYTTVNDGRLAQNRKNDVIGLGRSRMLGGGSSNNYMIHTRGSPEDFNSWAEIVDDQSWNYESVLPYFIKSEKVYDEEILNNPNYAPYHGTSGSIGITRQPHEETQKYLHAFEELDNQITLDPNGKDPLGYFEPLLAIAEGERQSSARAYLTPHINSKNLYVLKNTLVTNINFDENNNAVSVDVITDGNQTITVNANKEIIVSAGALNTPQLLMLSGVGPREHLESLSINVIADLPVGENLQDHPAFFVVYKMQKSDETLANLKPTELPMSTFFGMVPLNKSQTYPDYLTENFIIPHDSTIAPAFCSFLFGFDDDICNTIYNAGVGTELLISLVEVLQPKSRGRVLLGSTDAQDMPVIHSGFFSNECDLETATDVLEDFNGVSTSSYFQNVGAEMLELPLPECADLTFGSRDYLKCYAFQMVASVYRSSCTCAMGSVVDSKLLVKGVQRLRVVDSSVMPNINRANINAAVVMIAEKASDMIKEAHECNNN